MTELEQAKALILKLTADLRQMDQFVYRMANTDSQLAMYQAISEAWEITHKRMQSESNRIRALLVPEIVRTYANHGDKPASSEQKKIEHKP